MEIIRWNARIVQMYLFSIKKNNWAGEILSESLHINCNDNVNKRRDIENISLTYRGRTATW